MEQPTHKCAAAALPLSRPAVETLDEIVTVDAENLEAVFPAVAAAIRAAVFVAIDTEFTGIGSSPGLRDKDVSARYTAWRAAVLAHGLLQLGICCYLPPTVDGAGEGDWKAVAYCFVLLPEDDFRVSPNSVKFLAEAGMDFSRLFASAIRFRTRSAAATDRRPKTKGDVIGAVSTSAGKTSDRMRELFKLLCAHSAGAPGAGAGASAADGYGCGSAGPSLGARDGAAGGSSGGNGHSGDGSAASASARSLEAESSGRSVESGALPPRLVVHNGVLDLMFLYEAFFRPLPSTLSGVQ